MIRLPSFRSNVTEAPPTVTVQMSIPSKRCFGMLGRKPAMALHRPARDCLQWVESGHIGATLRRPHPQQKSRLGSFRTRADRGHGIVIGQAHPAKMHSVSRKRSGLDLHITVASVFGCSQPQFDQAISPVLEPLSKCEVAAQSGFSPGSCVTSSAMRRLLGSSTSHLQQMSAMGRKQAFNRRDRMSNPAAFDGATGGCARRTQTS